MVNFSFLVIYTETIENSKHDLIKTKTLYCHFIKIVVEPRTSFQSSQ